VTPWPTDDDLWACVDATVRDVILPALTDDWARQCAIGLVSVAAYARRRGDDPRPARTAQMVAALVKLADNPLVSWDHSDATAEVAVARALVAAVGRADADADAVRTALRPLLTAHLDDDLVRTLPLLVGFRGKLPDA
jgi:hypothetical protein